MASELTHQHDCESPFEMPAADHDGSVAMSNASYTASYAKHIYSSPYSGYRFLSSNRGQSLIGMLGPTEFRRFPV